MQFVTFLSQCLKTGHAFIVYITVCLLKFKDIYQVDKNYNCEPNKHIIYE